MDIDSRYKAMFGCSTEQTFYSLLRQGLKPLDAFQIIQNRIDDIWQSMKLENARIESISQELFPGEVSTDDIDMDSYYDNLLAFECNLNHDNDLGFFPAFDSPFN